MEPGFQKIVEEYNKITSDMSSGGSFSAKGGSAFGGDIAKLGKRQSELLPTVEKIQKLDILENQLVENQKLLADPDDEIKSMALDEGRRLESEILSLKSAIEEDLLPRDPNDEK